jgi:hypothetical protein
LQQVIILVEAATHIQVRARKPRQNGMATTCRQTRCDSFSREISKARYDASSRNRKRRAAREHIDDVAARAAVANKSTAIPKDFAS